MTKRIVTSVDEPGGSAAVGQDEQQIERATPEGYRLAVDAQHAFGRMKLEVAEAQRFVSAGRWLGRALPGFAMSGAGAGRQPMRGGNSPSVS